MKTRGKYFWKEKFYSFCSKHQEPNPDCEMCQFGSWENVIKGKVSMFFFKVWPTAWRFLANL